MYEQRKERPSFVSSKKPLYMQYLMLVCNANIFAPPDPSWRSFFFAYTVTHARFYVPTTSWMSTICILNVLGFFLFKSFLFLVQNISHLLNITALLSAIIFFYIIFHNVGQCVATRFSQRYRRQTVKRSKQVGVHSKSLACVLCGGRKDIRSRSFGVPFCSLSPSHDLSVFSTTDRSSNPYH